MRKREVNWKRGSACLVITMCMTLLAVFLLILYMTLTNITFANVIASTRADAIADSAAVYAQSYDYEYNKAQAETMTNLLTMYNNGASDFYELATGIQFDDDNTLTVKCVVTMPTFYPDLVGSDVLYAFDSSTVTSVNVFGNVLVVPEELASEEDADMVVD